MKDNSSSSLEEAAAPLLAALGEAGLPTGGFGMFVSPRAARVIGDAPAFDYQRAVPILLEWLPRID
jgi:hypothetical protein